METFKETSILKTCNVCGTAFEVAINVDRFTKKYCTVECENIAKESVPNAVCNMCNKNFYYSPYLKSANTHEDFIFCSIDCCNDFYTMQQEKNSVKNIKYNKYGYLEIFSPNHPYRDENNNVLLHRLIVEDLIREENMMIPELVKINGEYYLHPETSVTFHDNDPFNFTRNNLRLLSDRDRLMSKNMDRVTVNYWSDVFPDDITKFVQDLKYAKKGDACVDLRSMHDVEVPPNETVIIKTGLYVSIPAGYELQVRPRSGLSFKTQLIAKNTIGTIDSGYKYEMQVALHNLSNTTSEKFAAGDRISQIKLERVIPVDYIRKDTLEEVQREVEERGDRGGGLGHTGLK